MLNWPASVVGDPAAAAKACAEPSRSMVGVVEISQQFHDFLWIDVAKIIKWEEWGHRWILDLFILIF